MTRNNYLTLVQLNALRSAVQPIADVWGTPYLVGSCIERADFRDVDVRVHVSAKHLRHLAARRGALLLLNHVTSAWLTEIVRLPIDFQYQSAREADTYQARPRQPLMPPGLIWKATSTSIHKQEES